MGTCLTSIKEYKSRDNVFGSLPVAENFHRQRRRAKYNKYNERLYQRQPENEENGMITRKIQRPERIIHPKEEEMYRDSRIGKSNFMMDKHNRNQGICNPEMNDNKRDPAGMRSYPERLFYNRETLPEYAHEMTEEELILSATVDMER